MMTHKYEKVSRVQVMNRRAKNPNLLFLLLQASFFFSMTSKVVKLSKHLYILREKTKCFICIIVFEMLRTSE